MQKARYRYIAFHLDREVSREPLMNAIKARRGEMRAWLTYFDGEYGILKCGWLDKERAIELLRSIESIGNNEVKIETIRTSGTIKKVKKIIGKYP
jgi:RNase P/RNase MRP subunit POP5